MSQFVQFESDNKQESQQTKNNIDLKQYLNVFEFETTLPGTGEIIKFKPITVFQLKKLLINENENNQEKIELLLDNLLSECILNKNFNIDNLYLQDRLFLLIKLREKTKGSNYEINWTCPNCNGQSLILIDLSKLKIIKRKKINTNIIKINDKISVEMDHIKRKDYKLGLKYVSNLNEKSEKLNEINNLMALYASSIKKIITDKGTIENPTIENKFYIVENIPAKYYDKIKEWHEKNDFGILLKTKIKCIHCKEYEEEIDIPLYNFFL